jgi:hypothetical protein
VTNALKILRRRFGPIPDGVRREIVAEFADECRAYREQGMTDIERAEVAVKNAQNQLDEARKRLEAAKTPPKVKTVGERLADEHIQLETNGYDGYDEVNFLGAPTLVIRKTSHSFRQQIRDRVARVVAGLIDKAVADEREACAREVLDFGERLNPAYYPASSAAVDKIAQRIRNRK